MVDAPERSPDRVVVGFARALRDAGLDVPVGSTVAFAEALAVVDAARRDDVYWSGRATLVRRPEDAPVYDRVFARCFDGTVDLTSAEAVDPMAIQLAIDDGTEDADDDSGADDADDDGIPTLSVRWSPVEVLRTRDFAAYTPGGVCRVTSSDGRSPAGWCVASLSSEAPGAAGPPGCAPNGSACLTRTRRAGEALVRGPLHSAAPHRAAL